MTTGRPPRRLLQILGVGFGLAVTVGNTIGAGILRTPGEVAAQLPDPLLFLGVWVAGGLYAALGALSIAELGTMMPRSGGQYVFARHALGDYAGFIVGWSDWISTCGTSAAVSVVIAEYTGALFPALAGQTVPLALAVVFVFALIQWRGVRWGSNVQQVTTLLKALAFVALVAACFILGGGEGTTEAAAPAMPTGFGLFVAFVLALQAVIYTYDGWAGVVYFSEEVRDPARDIPRSAFGSVLSITAIYLLVNLALLYVLPMAQIAGSKLAVGAAADAIFGPRGNTVITALTILSMLSAINAYQLMASRVLFGMGRDGLFMNQAEAVNKGGTPTVALGISALVAALFIVGGVFENSRRIFENIIAVLAFFFVVNYIMSFISVFVLRRREPERARPYRAWGYPWTTGIVLLGSIAFLAGAVASDTRNSLYALALLAVSYPVFHLMKQRGQSTESSS
ncbi:MAG TPA: APC family permease [Blastocatellia bacterium]|nr:APC family permease [Blastocatellia bacterium]